MQIPLVPVEIADLRPLTHAIVERKEVRGCREIARHPARRWRAGDSGEATSSSPTCDKLYSCLAGLRNPSLPHRSTALPGPGRSPSTRSRLVGRRGGLGGGCIGDGNQHPRRHVEHRISNFIRLARATRIGAKRYRSWPGENRKAVLTNQMPRGGSERVRPPHEWSGASSSASRDPLAVHIG